MTTVAENIKNARKARGYTQKDLARLLQVKPAAVSAWEVGRNEPSIAMLRKIAELLGVPFDRLVGVETDNEIALSETIQKIKYTYIKKERHPSNERCRS